MRLTTLARKIEQTPSQLISYLEENGIEIKNGLHSKLDDETVKLIKSKFLTEIPDEEPTIPEIIEKVEEPIDINPKEIITENKDANTTVKIDDAVSDDNEEKSEEEQIVDEIEDVVLEVQEPKSEVENQKNTGTIEDLERENFDEIELIKVKKVKLEGIKVVGKIDLPEKPVKEAKTTEDKNIENQEIVEVKPKKEEKQHRRKFDRNKKNYTKERNRRILSYEEKLEREEREKLRQRRKKAKEDKSRKKQYYIKNIQPKAAKNLKKKKRTNLKLNTPEQVIVHKNPIKRFWSWLNGEYDSY